MDYLQPLIQALEPGDVLLSQEAQFFVEDGFSGGSGLQHGGCEQVCQVGKVLEGHPLEEGRHTVLDQAESSVFGACVLNFFSKEPRISRQYLRSPTAKNGNDEYGRHPWCHSQWLRGMGEQLGWQPLKRK